jgi:small subunit ribosomal protein S16
MALKIRLRQQGRSKRAFYRLVVMDSRARRDGKYLEAIGWYNPIEVQEEKQIAVKEDRIEHWLSAGAQLTEKAESLIKKTAPAIIQGLMDKKLAHRAKVATKRKASKKVKA